MSSKPPCFRVPFFNTRGIRAIRALEAGEATPYEQRLALKYILDELCSVYQVSFIPGSPDQSTFMQGRQFPGQEIIKALKFDPTALANAEEKEKKDGRTSR